MAACGRQIGRRDTRINSCRLRPATCHPRRLLGGETEFLRLVDAATTGKRWVAAGNYSPARELLWNRATVIVWLDLSLPRVLLRGLRRSLQRIFDGEPLFHGNRETLRRTFFSRESILWWIVTTFHRRRREFAELRSTGRFHHLTWLHVRTPDEARGILESLARRS